MRALSVRPTSNFGVVVRRGDGSEAGRLVSFAAIITAYRRVISDSGYGVGDSSGSCA